MDKSDKKFRITSILKPASITSVMKSKSASKIDTKIYGDNGRIEIPDLKISLPLYKGNDNPQEVVDKKNAAAFLEWPG